MPGFIKYSFRRVLSYSTAPLTSSSSECVLCVCRGWERFRNGRLTTRYPTTVARSAKEQHVHTQDDALCCWGERDENGFILLQAVTDARWRTGRGARQQNSYLHLAIILSTTPIENRKKMKSCRWSTWKDSLDYTPIFTLVTRNWTFLLLYWFHPSKAKCLHLLSFST